MFTPRNQRQNIGRAVLNVGGVYFLDFFWTKKSQGLIYQHKGAPARAFHVFVHVISAWDLNLMIKPNVGSCVTVPY